MGLYLWCCRCVPGLSILLWIFLTYQALGGRVPGPFSSRSSSETANAHRTYDWQHLSASQLIYVLYSVFLHLCGCLFFPARLCWAIWHIGDEVRSARFEAAELASPYTEFDASSSISIDDKGSMLSLAPRNPDAPLSRASSPRGSVLGGDADVADVLHAIILPDYKEDIDTMRETLSVLASHVLAKLSYDIYLAMEQRDPDAKAVATALIQEFKPAFHTISFTLHPGDINGEVAGKSSNVSWAARQLSQHYADSESRRSCVITVMDSDTHLSSNYFCLLTKFHHEGGPEAAYTLYSVPIIFDRNSNAVNTLVRTADIFWCGAGLSGQYRGSRISPPTSVYSLPLSLADHVGGWDTGPDSIGEDLHMYLKIYFATKGRFHSRIIYSPASQSNVSSNSKGVRGDFLTLNARYKQAMRHMWGALDTGFAVQKALEALHGHFKWQSSLAEHIPRRADGSMTPSVPLKLYEGQDPGKLSFSKIKLLLLFHRLFEAHFLPCHLTIALFSAIIYSSFVPPVVTHPLLLWCFGFTATLRIFGLVGVNIYLYLYGAFHQLCVRTREEEMKRAGLWAQMHAANGFSHRSLRRHWVDYTCMPLTGTLFGTFPAAVAESCHFWTDRLTYTVSAKPQLRVIVPLSAEKAAQLA